MSIFTRTFHKPATNTFKRAFALLKRLFWQANTHPPAPVQVFAALWMLFFAMNAAGNTLPDGQDIKESARALPEAAYNHLPRWRGFNLLNKYSADWSDGSFEEKDFRLISKLGFNFVRLPMDYRMWIRDGDWEKFDETALSEIDRAIKWGGKYDLHVSINFHRIPGYCVNPPEEEYNIWKDPEPLRVASLHWTKFARRYRHISNRNLSFNLINEPPRMDAEEYHRVIETLVEAIRREDPKRLIIADGLNHGREPVPELARLKIAQSARGYFPFRFTHYRAGWVDGSDKWPIPVWPPTGLYAYLYGDSRPEMTGSMVIEGEFIHPLTLGMHVHTVSDHARLKVRADGNTVFKHDFVCEPEGEEFREIHYNEEWEVYQCIYDREYEAEIPPKTERIEIKIVEGDWLKITGLTLTGPGSDMTLTLTPRREWGYSPGNVKIEEKDGKLAVKIGDRIRLIARQKLREESVEPWLELRDKGVGVMVGEWGVYNKTPHEDAMRWMEDCLKNWKQAEFGWALWNFRGDFGPLESGRGDVDYIEWHGYETDARMLEMLLR